MEPCAGCNIDTLNVVEEVGHRDQEIIAFFQRHGVLRTEMACPKCGQFCSLLLDPPFFRCQKSRIMDGVRIKCNFVQSIKANTWLSQALLPYSKVIKFITAWCTVPHLRQKFLVESFCMSPRAVVDWLGFCRDICIGSLELSDVDVVGGPGTTVEVDEVKFGKRRYKKGEEVEKSWVFGAFERETKRCVFERVPDRSPNFLKEVLLRRIAPGTSIISDIWRDHNSSITKHLTSSYSMNFIDPDSEPQAESVEEMWREVCTLPRYGRGKNNNDRYLAEFYWKRQYPINDRVHQFLLEVARQFPPDAN